jgi:hypothetical protein
VEKAMPNVRYELVPCHKCDGDLYGPVGVRVDADKAIDQQLKKIEIELSSSHPYHRVNGLSLKRYNDFQFPSY